MVVVSVMYTVFSLLAGGAAVTVSSGTEALMRARLVMVASSPVATLRRSRVRVSISTTLPGGVHGPTLVVLPFLVIGLVLGLYCCIAVALYVAVLLSAFVEWVRCGGVQFGMKRRANAKESRNCDCLVGPDNNHKEGATREESATVAKGCLSPHFTQSSS